jgi:hypothetical protein
VDDLPLLDWCRRADRDSLTGCLRGVDVAYYLIHSLGTGARFESRDRTNALNFAAASRTCGVSRIVYLGGLYPEAEKLSPHLESRKEVGEIFLASGVPTTVLRAAVILGSGSASFEMLRYLTERLGRHPDPAHRGQRRPALLVRLGHHPGGRQPWLRHRRPRAVGPSRDLDVELGRGRRPALPAAAEARSIRGRPYDPTGVSLQGR